MEGRFAGAMILCYGCVDCDCLPECCDRGCCGVCADLLCCRANTSTNFEWNDPGRCCCGCCAKPQCCQGCCGCETACRQCFICSCCDNSCVVDPLACCLGPYKGNLAWREKELDELAHHKHAHHHSPAGAPPAQEIAR